MNKAQTLRKLFPTFSFNSFSWKTTNSELEITFSYSLGTKYSFNSSVILHSIDKNILETLPKSEIDAYVATIGMSELLSYWKLTASPKIKIPAYSFSADQLKFWKSLLLEGMGEYFYQNQIDFTDENFVSFVSENPSKPLPRQSLKRNNNKKIKVLIPVGGGKDSAVSLELISNYFDTGSLTISAPESAHDTIAAAQIPSQYRLSASRKLDPLLFELNKQDFLNGHVPISASIAFISLLIARVNNFTHIAISNERSSNEGNIRYCNKEINHQYSKTFTFETAFQKYVHKYLPENTALYFSFLRPLYELQIGKLFSNYEHYHQVFRSCNKGQKTNTWCGSCSKCLFAWIILYPFMPEEKLTNYFGKNMFEDEQLLPIAKELLGLSISKPFECVGTHEESIAAFWLAIQKYKQINPNLILPKMLGTIAQEFQNNDRLKQVDQRNTEYSQRAQAILKSWNSEHTLPAKFEKVLKQALEKIDQN